MPKVHIHLHRKTRDDAKSSMFYSNKEKTRAGLDRAEKFREAHKKLVAGGMSEMGAHAALKWNGKDWTVTTKDSCSCGGSCSKCQTKDADSKGYLEAVKWAKRNADDAHEYDIESWVKRFGMTRAEAQKLYKEYNG